MTEQRTDSPTPRPRRILVMDDEEVVREVLIEMLMELGYAAEGAAEGGAAVACYQAALAAGARFDVVLLDLSVRVGLGGLATLVQLRALDPTVCAVVSSGYVVGPEVVEHRAHGFTDVLSKPFRLEDLEAMLARLAPLG
jgi:two-component system, cell cycle sensor histidine kinase and response regulator CckA